MARTRIKVCGITNLEDAEKCFSLGVDYLGLIFADSPRKISMETARRIRAALPQAELVGVFVDSPIELIKHTFELCGLDIIQLHGEETPAYCSRLFEATAIPLMKAISPGWGQEPNELSTYKKTDFFLFDLDKSNVSSFLLANTGSLERVWLRAAGAVEKGYKIFLGGGLDPSNVRKSIETVNPFSVDVCRGVERRPGVKDGELLKKLIAEVRM